MIKELGFHVYRPQLLYVLIEDDYDWHLEFAEWRVSCGDPLFYKKILYSDEAIFKLNGQVNRHNSVY